MLFYLDVFSCQFAKEILRNRAYSNSFFATLELGKTTTLSSSIRASIYSCLLNPESLLSASILAKVSSSTLNATVLMRFLPLLDTATTYNPLPKAAAILESASE